VENDDNRLVGSENADEARSYEIPHAQPIIHFPTPGRMMDVSLTQISTTAETLKSWKREIDLFKGG
jgi:hypothetical protein